VSEFLFRSDELFPVDYSTVSFCLLVFFPLPIKEAVFFCFSELSASLGFFNKLRRAFLAKH